jgi:Tol biopolymer transport system component
MTQAGMILGTAGYMSPEQARGKPVDKRADIWAFGVVLFELLTGKPLFAAGDTVTDILAAVVTREPDWQALPAETPAHIRRLLERCLCKDPKLRLRDIGEARIAVEERPAPALPPAAVAAGRASPRLWMAATALSTLALAAVSVWHFRETAPPRETLRFQVPLDVQAGRILGRGHLALSADGRKLAFSQLQGGEPALAVRTFDSLEVQPLAGTLRGTFPFWSPDGKRLAFSAGGSLKTVEISGGPPQTICNLDAGGATAGFWTADGTIYFGGPKGILRVRSSGGEPVPVTILDGAGGETGHAYPYLLPDGRHLLVSIQFKDTSRNGIYAVPLDGKQKKRVVAAMRSFTYVPPGEHEGWGHLLYMRGTTLVAQPFNTSTLEAVGEPYPVAEHIRTARSLASFSASANGVLAFDAGMENGDGQLTWFDRNGKSSPMGSPGEWGNVALSRDGSRAVAVRLDLENARSALWLFDLKREVPTMLTVANPGNSDPLFSADGSKIAFSSSNSAEGTRTSLFWIDSGGAGKEQQFEGMNSVIGASRPTDWSADGRYLLFTVGTRARTTLWVLTDPFDAAKRHAAAYLDTPFSTGQGQFVTGPESAPGGAPRWVAYDSNESNSRYEVYVQSFPAGAAKIRISNGGGTQPRWRRDGKELFYIAYDGKLMAVDVKPGARFGAGIPHALFDSRMGNPVGITNFRYDVTPDGQRFLVTTVKGEEKTSPDAITVVVNWMAGAKH